MLLEKDITTRMPQVDIAKQARISTVTVNYIIKGNRKISEKMAVDLETVTGVAREAWMWPLRWYNPYIDTSNKSLHLASEYAGKKLNKT